MADPVTLTMVMLGTMAAGTTVAALGAVRQGQAASNAANYNATLASQNQVAMLAQGEAASQQMTRDAERRQGAAMATIGASGVQATGSPMEVLADNARSATLDNLTSQYNYRMKGLGYQDSAALLSAQASNDSTAGYLAGLGTALNGTGTGISKFG